MRTWIRILIAFLEVYRRHLEARTNTYTPIKLFSVYTHLIKKNWLFKMQCHHQWNTSFTKSLNIILSWSLWPRTPVLWDERGQRQVPPVPRCRVGLKAGLPRTAALTCACRAFTRRGGLDPCLYTAARREPCKAKPSSLRYVWCSGDEKYVTMAHTYSCAT